MENSPTLSFGDSAWLGILDALKMVAASIAYFCVRHYKSKQMPHPYGFLEWARLLGFAVFTPFGLSLFMSVTGFTDLVSSDDGGFTRAYVFMLCAGLCGAFAKPLTKGEMRIEGASHL